MRIHYPFFLIILIAVFFTIQPVFAGNVLLPSDSTDRSGQPNLGLMPTETQTAAPAPAPTSTPPAATVNPLPKTDAYTPKNMAQPQKPPVPVPTSYAPAPLTESVTISVSNPSWTAADLDVINRQIGLGKSSVESECRMGFSGSIATDKGSYQVDSKISTTATLGYNGKINSGLFNFYAACNSAPKPDKYAYITKINDKFRVVLFNAFCSDAASLKTVHKITLTQVESGLNKCTYSP